MQGHRDWATNTTDILMTTFPKYWTCRNLSRGQCAGISTSPITTHDISVMLNLGWVFFLLLSWYLLFIFVLLIIFMNRAWGQGEVDEGAKGAAALILSTLALLFSSPLRPSSSPSPLFFFPLLFFKGWEWSIWNEQRHASTYSFLPSSSISLSTLLSLL